MRDSWRWEQKTVGNGWEVTLNTLRCERDVAVFAMVRSESKEKSNMEIHDVALSGELSFQGDTKSDKRTHTFGNITFPVYKNPKALKPGIMLVGFEDPKVQQLLKKVSNEEEIARKRAVDEKGKADDKAKANTKARGAGKRPRLQ